MFLCISYPEIYQKKSKIIKTCLHVPMTGLSTPRFEDESLKNIKL